MRPRFKTNIPQRNLWKRSNEHQLKKEYQSLGLVEIQVSGCSRDQAAILSMFLGRMAWNQDRSPFEPVATYENSHEC